MWWLLAVLGAVQLYFVRELLAAFALFTAGFTALAMMAFAVYMMRTGWEFAVARMAHGRQRVVSVAIREKAAQKAT
jgi:hypothetical protein